MGDRSGIEWTDATWNPTYDQPTGGNDACTHKRVIHQHGTHACYVLDRCRCHPCRTSTAAYEKHRKLWLGDFPKVDPPYVDAEPVRAYTESLIARGMGRKRIAEVSGVPHGSLSKLVYGDPKRNMAPSRRVARKTAERLLACPFDVADGAKVPRDEFDKLLAELLARGWTKTQIARRVTGPHARSLQAGRYGHVTARNIRILRRLLFEPVPRRLHPRWVSPISLPKRMPRLVDPITPGVPDEPEVAAMRRQLQLKFDRVGLIGALRLSAERDGRRFDSRLWLENFKEAV